MGENQLQKIIEKRREKYIPLIEPTLTEPIFIIRDRNNGYLFIKSFESSKKEIYFAGVIVKRVKEKTVVSLHQVKLNKIINRIFNKGEVIVPTDSFSAVSVFDGEPQHKATLSPKDNNIVTLNLLKLLKVLNRDKEISILKLSEVLEDNQSFRIDSEYFKKEYLFIFKEIKNYLHEQLGNFSKITDGEHGSVIFQKNGIKYLTAENIKNGIVNISNIRYVNKEVDERNKRASVKLEDILISIKGTLGEVAIAEKWLLPANMNRDVAIIKNNKKDKFINYYIALFLMSKIGKKLFERLGSGGVQQMITLERLRTIIIPKLDITFQKKVSYFYKVSLKKLEQSKTLYKEAEKLLLKELDLLDFKPTTQNIAIKSFSESFGKSGRLDAEYYQPKYDEVEEKIKSYRGGYIKLSELVIEYSTGYPYKSNSFLKNGISLIRINNIMKDGLDLENAVKIPYKDKNLSLKDIVKLNDILISMSGTIGLSCKIHKNIEAVINQRILRLNIKNYSYDVLPLIINSIIGKLQIKRIGTGGVQTNISSKDIFNIIIPLIDPSIQTQIEEKIQKSFQLKKESKELLELAKKSVEIAIKEGEERAMEFIKEKRGTYAGE